MQCACRWSSHCGRRARRAVIVNDCEYHSPTSIVCSVPKMLLPAGACLLSASNDGSDFGFGVEFRLFDDASLTPGVVSNEQRVTILRSQLQNVQRAIVNIQRMEEELRQQLQMVDMPLSASTFGALVPAAAAGGATTGGGLSESTAQAPAATIADMWDSIVHSLEEHDDREIRIFVSSPFRDMQEERDQFVRWNRAPTIDRWPAPTTNNCTRQCVCVCQQVKRVMPRLRKICNERDVVLRYVDLRWGVTGKQSEQATMLLMCLRELAQSNLFVGCYGERYGWCIGQEGSTRERNDLLKRSFDVAAQEFPWINSLRDKSVTEIEMRMVRTHLSLNLSLADEWANNTQTHMISTRHYNVTKPNLRNKEARVDPRKGVGSIYETRTTSRSSRPHNDARLNARDQRLPTSSRT